MNGRNQERKTRATMKFVSWLRKFHPEMHAAVMQRMGGREAPAAGALNQLGEAWDMFYPSNYYKSAGYRGRWHDPANHAGYGAGGLGQLGQGDWWEASVSTTPTTADENGAWYSDILDFAKEAVPAYLAYDAQKDLMDLNMERAQQGLDPIDPGLTAPQIRVVHDLPPETRGIIDQFKMGGNVLMWAALGLGAFFVVRMLR